MRQHQAVFLTCVLLICISESHATNLCVSLNGGSISPFTNWAMAATNIQDAVNWGAAGDIISVTNGTYTLTNRITISKGITVKSVNGYQLTLVNGNSPNVTNRCFFLNHANALVDGFCISNGGSGGVQFNAGTGGTIQNCLIRNNIGAYGGGVLGHDSGTISNCIITNNSVTADGGGIYFEVSGTIRNCRICNNTAVSYGGGVRLPGASLDSSIISGNVASNSGGGIYSGAGHTIRNCLIVSNTAVSDAGGIYFCQGTLYNCTIVSNSCGGSGGGVKNWQGGDMQNCIIYYNHAPSNPNLALSQSTNAYCCTPIAITGTGNITYEPLFVNSSPGDYRLSPNSPCVNAGFNQAWMASAQDLDGHHRIDPFSQLVDMGCYEYLPHGTMFTIR